jgi:tetraacyldisaccharide 4'-kinase
MMPGSKTMGNSFEQSIRPILNGEKRGPFAAIVRGGLRVAEIPYTSIVKARNAFYERQILKSHRLARPVISVGNITTGGTGKTPVVRWLADSLRDHRPAILLRGYKSANNISDEQMLLQEQLPDVPVIARPSRIRGAAAALAQQSDTGLFILDDGMQHRKIARDFELVLIDATNPFGYGHVLPRGFLREPLSGLARASAFLITRANQSDDANLQKIRAILAQHNSQAPVYHADHVLKNIRQNEQLLPLESFRNKRFFLFCGIGNPSALKNQLSGLGLNIVSSQFFPDHHIYTESELSELAQNINNAIADLLLTTEKDWTKIAPLDHALSAKICRTELSLTFHDEDEAKLLELVRLSISRPSR